MNWSSLFNKKKKVTELYRKIIGDGAKTIVFIAGLGGTTSYWESRIHSLESDYRIVLVDLLGFGDSPKPWIKYDVEQHVLKLHEALKDLGPITLVGHSLGSLLSIAYAARHPQNIERITIMSLPYFGSEERAYKYFNAGKVKYGYFYTNIGLIMLACVMSRRVFGRVLPFFIRDMPREVLEDLSKHTMRSSSSSLWEVVYRYDVAKDLKILPESITVVCIHGDEDKMAPIFAVKQLAESNPNFRLHVLNGADHHPFLRETDECLTLIKEHMLTVQ